MTVAVSDSLEVRPSGPLTGTLEVPGDKSISHRVLLLGALAEGRTRAAGFLESADCLATLRAISGLGVRVERPAPGEVVIEGAGLDGLQAPDTALDCGNAGTAMRLLAGVLAGQPFSSTLTGDASLSRRPMRRVIKPLSNMGAYIAANGGRAPLRITGKRPLKAIRYASPVASAQVKSAVLLAGLYARGVTCVSEPAASRDHTERLLQTFGVELRRDGRRICIEGGSRLRAATVQIPGDLSSAAFFLAGAAMQPGSELLLENVGINPTRTGVIDLLREMGADIALLNIRQAGNEPVADLRVRGRRLRGIAIPPERVPGAIDDLPAVLAAAACAEGVTTLHGAAELRVKESDRLAAMARGLAGLGIAVELFEDGVRIRGGQPSGGTVDSQGDHRIAMAFAVLGGRATGPVTVRATANIETSFPGFADCTRRVGLDISNQDISA